MTDPVSPPDPTRRRFFRQFAGDVVSSVGTVIGAAQVLQQQSAEAARELLAGDTVATDTATGTTTVIDASTAGWRAPFRWDGDVCFVVDQRRLPDVIADIEVRGAADAVTAINEGAISGGAAQAQLAAVTVALVAGRARASRPFARRATIRGAANALRLTRPGSAAMGLAIDRMLALLDTFGGDAAGEAVEAALRAEAAAIISEATIDHGQVVERALVVLPADTGSVLRVLTAGSSGSMGSGQFGTALSTAISAHHAERRIHVTVAETRPGFEGARVATWELAQAGVAHDLVTDAAAPSAIAGGEIDVVLVTAERIAANGDVIAISGTYPLALAAREAGVPFLVLAATSAVQPGTATGLDATLEDGRPAAVLRAAGTRIAPEGTVIRNPRLDVTPAALITGIVTEAGLSQPPYGPALATAVHAAEQRRAAAAGFAALLAKRAAADSDDAETAGVQDGVDGVATDTADTEPPAPGPGDPGGGSPATGAGS